MKIQVKVKPNAKQQKIASAADGILIISLKSAPIEGKANQELIELLAKKYRVSRSQISIHSGLTARYKLIEISE